MDLPSSCPLQVWKAVLRRCNMSCRLLIALAPFAFAAAGSAWVLTAASRQPLQLLREAAAGAVASCRKLLSPANATSAAYCAATAAVAVVGVLFLGLVRQEELPTFVLSCWGGGGGGGGSAACARCCEAGRTGRCALLLTGYMHVCMWVTHGMRERAPM